METPTTSREDLAPNDLENGSTTLLSLAALAGEIGADVLAEEARTLAARVAEGRSYVACLGQFKRGKSSLINTITGFDILPVGTAPVTSVVTVVRHGERSVRVRLADSGWHTIKPAELPAYATEDQNPGNSKGVRAIEVFLPSPILKDGMCLVDTPGLGSVFDANTEATREFVPHVDAAIIVLGADPPITAEEIALVEQVAQQVEHLIFVLNKADRVRPDELEAALAFTRRVLTERLQLEAPVIYAVSTLRVREGNRDGDWDAFVHRLERLAAESGRALVAAALERGVQRLKRRLQDMLARQEAALTQPLAESRAHLAALREASAAAQNALRDMGPLFDAELAAQSRKFAERRVDFLQQALPQAQQELFAAVDRIQLRFGPAVRTAAFEEATRIARSLLQPWLQASAREAERAYREIATRFTEMAERVLERLNSEGVWVELGLADLSTIEASFEGRSRFIFTDLLRISSPAGIVPLLRWLADVILPPSFVRKSAKADAFQFLRELLTVNAHRVENDLKQRIQDNRLRLEGRIRVALKEILRSAEAAIEEAQQAQEQGEAAVAEALQRVRRRRAQLARL